MATFYLDYEGGNDANDGLSFANRWKTFVNGATAARTAAGDTIRVMASPDPTSLGVTGVWTSAQLETAKAGSASSNVTPITFTTSGQAHGYSTGDTVVITGVNGAVTANGTWEITVISSDTFSLNGSVNGGVASGSPTCRRINNSVVKLSSPLTANIDCCGEFTNWTASTNVTSTVNTAQVKEHRAGLTLAIASAFTTGKAAYKTLPTTLDLSGYQQISLWIRALGSPLPAAGGCSIRLCSDTIGNTTVNTFNLPAIPTGSLWIPVTIDNGSALGSNINSIAFDVNTDLGTLSYFIDNIIACKASNDPTALSLTSLIGKNTAGEQWWPIQSINGTRVVLDCATSADLASPTTVRGYFSPSGYGTSTVTTFKRETISTLNHGLGATFAPSNEGGVTYSGGWDRTDMSTQTGETWFDNRHITGTCYAASNTANSGNWTNFNAVRFATGFDAGIVTAGTSFAGINNLSAAACISALALRGAFITTSTPFDNMSLYACNTGILTSGGTGASVLYNANFTNCNILSCGTGASWGVSIVSRVSAQMAFSSCKLNNNAIAINTNKSNNILFSSCYMLGNDNPVSQSDIQNGTSLKFISCTCDTSMTMVRPCKWTFKNCTLNQFSGVSTNGNWSWADDVICSNTVFTNATEIQNQQTDSNCRVFSHNHDNTSGNHKIFTDGGLISAATDQRNTASGISWKLQPTSTNRSSAYPLDLSLAKVAVAANSLVTVKAWMRRDNTNLTMRLVCKGGQIAGVSSDVVASMSAAANTWQELTITFTPTEAGVVEITAEAYGGSTYSGWVDDMTITQA